MACSKSNLLQLLGVVLVFTVYFFPVSVQSKHNHKHRHHNKLSLSFPLTSAPVSRSSPSFTSSLVQLNNKKQAAAAAAGSPAFSFNYKTPFKYSMALIVSLPVGTPPQSQQMVLDTGSQLSWIQCHRKQSPQKPPATSFDPSLSSSFSELPCTHPVCKPRIPDFTLPTTCDQNRLCHYSYFYADGTLAEGNLVRETFAFSKSRSGTTPPLILGCAAEAGEAEGILGMNLGRLSFVSQAKVPKFSYCVPIRNGQDKINPTGTFYLGENPNSRTFKYINLINTPPNQRMPNFDPLAYTVPLVGIKIGGKRLNIPATTFRADAGGSGQTMIDSGTQYTFLVDAAYGKVREEVVRLTGTRMKKDYAYGGALDMCYGEGNAIEIGRMIGDMSFEFENGVEMLIRKERVVDDVGGGVHCVGIGRSDSLGVASNIIGNFHQQNLWMEFDTVGKRVGFGEADCSRTV